jgi:hypothetical protein
LVRDPSLNGHLGPWDWLELVALGLTISFSPPHLGLLFWLMVGPHGLMRASLLVASWLAISAMTIGLLAMVVRGSIAPLWFLPTAWKGVMSPLLDGLAAVALVTVAAGTLFKHHGESGHPSQGGGGFRRLLELPLPLLLALSSSWQLLSPEDGLLYARILNQLRQSGIEGAERLGAIALLWLISSSLMLVPLVLLLALGPMQVGRWIEPFSRGLDDHSGALVAILSLSLACYLGWQGWIGWQTIG